MRFRADAPRIPVARRLVSERAQDAGASPEAVRVIALLTTEAVTNAVLHGPRDGQVDVDARVIDGCFHVGVRDESRKAPVLRDPGATDLSGRGVMLIDRLSTHWGVQQHDGSKTVWFEVAI